jgi:hypothetical protein
MTYQEMGEPIWTDYLFETNLQAVLFLQEKTIVPDQSQFQDTGSQSSES